MKKNEPSTNASEPGPICAIRLDVDYESLPLWDASPGGWGEIDPETLDLSPSLKHDLMHWATLYHATLDYDDPTNSGFQSDIDEQVFLETRDRLAQRLRDELPGIKISIREQ